MAEVHLVIDLLFVRHAVFQFSIHAGRDVNKLSIWRNNSNVSTTNVFCQLIAGIHALHTRGISRRDHKPKSLLITSDGKLVITDFSAARRVTYGEKMRILIYSKAYIRNRSVKIKLIVLFYINKPVCKVLDLGKNDQM